MITMVMYAKIRRMFYREHLSINEIQRRTVSIQRIHLSFALL